MTAISIPGELLGVNHTQIPHVELPADYDPLDHPLCPGEPVSLYTIPGQPDYLLRRHSLQARLFKQPSEVIDHITSGLHHYERLATEGLQVPAHRHTEATLPNQKTGGEGRILSLTARLPLVRLEIDKPEHLAGTLHVITGLSLYAAQVLQDGHPDILWDVFRRDQHSLLTSETLLTPPDWPGAPQRAFVHDFGLEIVQTHARVGSNRQTTPKFDRALCRLGSMTDIVLEIAQGTAYEEDAQEIAAFVREELPTPRPETANMLLGQNTNMSTIDSLVASVK